MKKDKTLIISVIGISAFILFLMFLNGLYMSNIQKNYKYTITKEINDKTTNYYVNEYKIDDNGCIHFKDFSDSLVLCGDYKIKSHD